MRVPLSFDSPGMEGESGWSGTVVGSEPGIEDVYFAGSRCAKVGLGEEGLLVGKVEVGRVCRVDGAFAVMAYGVYEARVCGGLVVCSSVDVGRRVVLLLLLLSSLLA